ncbi:hypothetical protein V2G26_020474 [Clonostachys chloroleuca]
MTVGERQGNGETRQRIGNDRKKKGLLESDQTKRMGACFKPKIGAKVSSFAREGVGIENKLGSLCALPKNVMVVVVACLRGRAGRIGSMLQGAPQHNFRDAGLLCRCRQRRLLLPTQGQPQWLKTIGGNG